MSPILAGVAFAVTAGAVVAVSAREARVALVGLAVTLAAAPFLADPLPPLSTLALRVVGAALAAYLLRAAFASAGVASDVRRRNSGQGGSRTGWPTEGLLALAAWIVGITVSIHLEVLNPTGPGISSDDLLLTLTGASMSTAAGLATSVIAIVPALRSQDGFRTAVGLLILIQGALLFRTGVAGAPGDLEQLADVALTLSAALAGSILIALESARDALTDRSDLDPWRSTPDRRATDGQADGRVDGRVAEEPE